jgi:hypothetical protein
LFNKPSWLYIVINNYIIYYKKSVLLYKNIKI